MSITAKLCALFVVLSPLLTDAKLGPLREVFGWKELDFDFPNDSARQSALRSGYFVPGNSLPIDVQYVDGRVFITMPRWKEGIPATVATVPASPSECVKGRPCAPLLQPFPDWSWNSGEKSCEGLTSVFRINLDKCGRLWILDSSAVNILSSETKYLCPPQLFSFDLSNDQLIKRYTFPNNVFKTDSLLITVALDTISTAKNCANIYAYSADVTTYGLIVTDTKRGNSWRVENKLFYPYPNWGNFKDAGESFDLMDGMFSLAIYPELNPETRISTHWPVHGRIMYRRTFCAMQPKQISGQENLFTLEERNHPRLQLLPSTVEEYFSLVSSAKTPWHAGTPLHLTSQVTLKMLLKMTKPCSLPAV